jgi:hypothetical protein
VEAHSHYFLLLLFGDLDFVGRSIGRLIISHDDL